MRGGDLNLARRPFGNPRPVRRMAILLWLAGAAVAAFNVNLYLKHYAGTAEQRMRLENLVAETEREQAKVDQLRSEVASYDLAWQNEQSTFVNAKIAERSFSWSELFDRLSEVLPADARLLRLSPAFGASGRRRGRGRGDLEEGEVLLAINGAAKSPEVILSFVDDLFLHPSFRDPNLSGEDLQEGVYEFDLSVIYRAQPAEPPVSEEAVTEEGAPGGEAEAVGEESEAVTAESDEAPGPPPAEATEE